jgi:N-sulfoglucosamine sulfohydrolase
MKRRTVWMMMVAIALAHVGLSCNPHGAAAAPDASKPNIVWIMAEDIGPQLSCYGAPAVKTPVLDALAAQGARYNYAFCTAPVCSTARSAMITGMYQNTISANQHRTANADKKPLPDGVRTIVGLLRDAGYYTILGGGKRIGGANKTDLNFTYPKTDFFDTTDFNSRPKDKPFYLQTTFPNTHRAWGRDKVRPIDPKDVVVPPYYPDTPLVRRDIADGLEEVQKMDRLVGHLLDVLTEEGVADNTLLFFIGDNGLCQVRGKQFLYDAGTHVPLIVRWPGKVKPGTVSDDLVSTIDISAAVLAAAGVKLPDDLQGRDFLDPAVPKRDYVFAARDKMDDTHDAMRSIRNRKYSHILNLMPERAYCQLNEYKEKQYPLLALLNVMNMKGQLNAAQKPFMADHKPAEELYDLTKDPYEVHNVADDPAYADVKKRLRAELEAWRKSVNDQGVSDAFRKGGWPATYPTHSLAEWEARLAEWEKKLLHGPGAAGAEKPKRNAAPKNKKGDKR